MTAPRSLENDLQADYFWDAPVDPTLIDNEPSSEQKSPLDQTTDPYSNIVDDNYDSYPTTGLSINMFIPDDFNLSEMTDSSFVLADDSFCGLDDMDETDSFRKVRREDLCHNPPMSQTKPRIRPKKNARLSDLRFFYKDPMMMDISEAMCPPDIFGTSTLPTCLTSFDGRSIPVPGRDWFNLEDVFRTSRTIPFNCEHGSIPLMRSTKLPNHWDVQVVLFFFGVVRTLLLEYVRNWFELLADQLSRITFVGNSNIFVS